MRRILTALIAFALIGLVPIATASSAGADSAADRAASSRSASQERAAAKPPRRMKDNVVKRGGRLIFQGRVIPRSGPLIVQKSNCRDCKWKRYDKVNVKRSGKWKTRITAPRNGSSFYRGFVQATRNYSKSYTGVWRTFRR